jgi:hypothetical protein
MIFEEPNETCKALRAEYKKNKKNINTQEFDSN